MKNTIEKEIEACEEIKPNWPPQPSTILTTSKRWQGLNLWTTSLNRWTLPKSARKISNPKENNILIKLSENLV